MRWPTLRTTRHSRTPASAVVTAASTSAAPARATCVSSAAGGRLADAEVAAVERGAGLPTDQQALHHPANLVPLHTAEQACPVPARPVWHRGRLMSSRRAVALFAVGLLVLAACSNGSGRFDGRDGTGSLDWEILRPRRVRDAPGPTRQCEAEGQADRAGVDPSHGGKAGRADRLAGGQSRRAGRTGRGFRRGAGERAPA